MQKLTKAVSRQDANFKLSPSSSNETSINLSKEISALISDESSDVTFKLYKSDFIKAMGALCLIPTVYNKKDTAPTPVASIFSDLSKQIDAQFGEAETSFYTIFHFKREDGRSYFNNLKQANGFNLRAFLVEQFSFLTFEKLDDGTLALRVETTTPQEDLPEELAIAKEEAKSNADKQPLQQIFYGAPGTGKSYAIQAMLKQHGNDKAVRTTFHPDSDYASFVGAYKPTMQDLPMSYISEGIAKYAQKWEKHEGTEKKIVYKYVPQAFLKAYVKAWSDLDNPYFLVIEEINRGNCAQIFGDLFQLLDRNSQGASSYAIHADDDIRQFLANDEHGFALQSETKPEGLTQEQRDAIAKFVHKEDNGSTEEIGEKILSGELLLLPPNLHIWATMNTSDQSLFPIDSAFKRRWDWEYIAIDYNPKDKNGEPMNWKIEVNGKYYSWGKFLAVINPIILGLTQSTDKQMGYFFAKPDEKSDKAKDKKDVISKKVFVNKVLFYLWGDVLKDYPLGSEPFLNSETHKGYDFTDFFSQDKDFVEEFLSKDAFKDALLKDEETPAPDMDGSTKVNNAVSLRVDGRKSQTITYAFYLIVASLAKSKTFDEIKTILSDHFERDVDTLIKSIPSAEGYAKENGWCPYNPQTTIDGITYVVTNQWKRTYLPEIETLANNVNVEFVNLNETAD